jgi:sporulation protein YlmC with PRC-barrel domain
MEKKLILEDIQRIMLLSDYNMDMTLSENTTILENRALYSDVLKVFSRDRAIAKELTLLMKDTKFISELKAGKIVNTTGKELRTFSDVIHAVKTGTISEKELARFNWAVFRSTPNNSIRIELAKDIVKSDSFISKYGKMTPTEAKNELLRQGLDPKDAQRLATAYRDSRSNTTRVQQTLDDLASADEILKLKEAEAAKKVKEAEILAQDIKIAENKKLVDERKLELAKIKDSSPSKVKLFLRTNGAVKFVKNLGKWTIGNKWFWILGGGTLAGYWMWRNWAKVQGYVEDLLDPWDETSGDDGAVADGAVAGLKVPGGGNDQEKPIVYKNCSPNGPFKKGCKDYLGGEKEITALQKEFELPMTGEFDTKLENEVVAMYGKNTLTRDELYGILGII